MKTLYGEDALFCSTIIPTIGRPSLIHAVESVLYQDLPHGEFELIVVNDSGIPLSPATWQSSERVQVIDTNRRERSIARNTGAAAAKGRFLHFLDDDDWLAPGALSHFWELSQQSQAQWLYGISQLVDRKHKPLIQLQHGLQGRSFLEVMAGEWIPLQSSLIGSSAFFKVGGFNPRISGPEDIDLLRRVALTGELAETPHLVANIVMGSQGSTTDYATHPKASQWSREQILEAAGVFDTMRRSATTPYWKGRLVRVYFTSMVWNIQHARPLTAASRGTAGLLGMLLAGRYSLSKEYWSALARPYSSGTFEKGFLKAGLIS
jgi:glycosyltransferase involved in cell wall biosynthesis